MAKVTWNLLAIDFDMAVKAFERTIKAFESLERTYDELIEFCETYSKKIRQ